MGHKKQPVAQATTKPEKRPRAVPLPPKTGVTWSFSMLDKEGPFGWQNVPSAASFLEILDKKKNIESMPLAQIGQAGSHNISIDKLCKEAQKRLEERHWDDIGELYSIRISGKERIFCYLDGLVMRVIWWDPDHKVCPSHLKS